MSDTRLRHSPAMTLQGCAELGGTVRLATGRLSIRANSLTAILGPNGSGKSTLLRCLAGLTPITRGEATLFGKPLGEHDGKQLAWVGQHLDADPLMTVEHFVMQGRRPWLGAWRAPRHEDRQAVAHALRKMELDDKASHPMGRLSGGERQRAALARAFAQSTPVLLLDEPTNHLDVRHQQRLMRDLREACLGGRTIITVLHDIALAANHADQIIVVDRGRVIAEGPPATTLSDATLKQAWQWPLALRRTAGGEWTLQQGQDAAWAA